MAKKNAPVETEERKERGTSLPAQIKAAFLEIMGEWTSSNQVASATLDQYKELFESVPLTRGVGIPLEIQLANIEMAITKMFESKDIDEDELRKLLNRKARVQKAIAEDE